MRIPEGLENGKIFIGKRENPVAIIKRKEIQGYMSELFYFLWDHFENFNAGMGLPFGGSPMDYPRSFIKALVLFKYQKESYSGS
jgi:hypothetical protein